MWRNTCLSGSVIPVAALSVSTAFWTNSMALETKSTVAMVCFLFELVYQKVGVRTGHQCAGARFSLTSVALGAERWQVFEPSAQMETNCDFVTNQAE